MSDEAELRKEIGDRLKQAREKAGFVLAKDFCDKHKFALDLYLSYEKGDVPVKASQVLKYCKILRVTLQWLMVGANF
jgi:transcriptional regulator with XRE-family HTH domain